MVQIDSGATRPATRTPRAFAACELLTVIVIVAILAAILATMMPDSRRRSQLAGSLTNQQRLGAGIADYGLENEDSVVSFTWRTGESRTCGDITFPVASSDLIAAANQAICILREQGGRTDITPTAFPNWLPHTFYNLLPLMVYMDEPLPSKLLVSPGDRFRLEWQRAVTSVPGDPNGPFFSLACRPGSGTSGAALTRWPYSSSYEMGPSFFSPDRSVGAIGTISQASGHSTYNIPGNTPLGRRRLSEVAFPSHKAVLYEQNQRFFGQYEAFFMSTVARIPVLFADGGGSVRSMAQANDGWNPANGTASPTTVVYAPDTLWETPTESGASSVVYLGRIRWTQRGLEGRDFSAPEVAP